MTVIKTRPCSLCEKPGYIEIDLDSDSVGLLMNLWKAGSYIQDVFPMLSADDREQMMTGIHPDCWDEIFK
jgi:hypothetical protein